MAQQQARDIGRASVDRTRAGQSRGSIGFVLLIAMVLVGVGMALMMIGRPHAEPYILFLLAVLAMFGVFVLFALAAGMLTFPSNDAASPLIKALVDGGNNAIVVTDTAGRVVYANAAYLKLVDATSADDVRPVERVFVGDPGVSEAVFRLLKAAREGRRLQEEVRVDSMRGETGRWLRMRVRPLGASKREAKLTVWSIADVTRELERQENVFQELQHAVDYLDHAPAGFFSVDAAGNISYLNATLAEWLEQDLAEVGSGGLKLRDIIAGEGGALVTTLSAAPGEVKTELFDIDLKTKGGRNVPARLYHKVAFGADGTPGPSRTLVINRGRRQRQRSAARGGSALHALLPEHADGDRHRRPPGYDRALERVVRAAVQSGGEGRGQRRPFDPRGGRRARPLRRSKPRSAAPPTSRARSIRSMPRSKAPANALHAFSPQRSRRTAITRPPSSMRWKPPSSADLQNQLNQQQKMELVGQLAGGIAHDFNNVLGAIMMASDFLVNAHKPTDPSFQDIIQIRQNANRAAALVRHLLAFSRKQTLRPQVIDLGEVVHDLHMLLKRLIGERITLNAVPQRDLWPVKADLAQFEQVIVNLGVNARDAMAEGGRLTLRTANVGADQSAKFQYKGMPIGEYVLVEVQDTGTGIPAEIIDKIFDPFFTTKDVGKGTGLGLSTVYGIVKQTGGFVYVDSVIGEGTTFRIFIPRYIPAADDVQPPQLPETTAPALAGALSAAEDAMKTAADLTGQGVILLVEDEDGLRALNARGLASRGYTVIEAGNGVEAMEMLEREGGKIDLVVSDVVMPEMDGPTLLKELRKKNPETKIIFVSGYAEDAFQKSLPDPDDYNFLAKPFTLKQLVAKVKETMATV